MLDQPQTHQETSLGLTKEEFRRVARRLRPDIDDDEFDQMWTAMIEARRRRWMN